MHSVSSVQAPYDAVRVLVQIGAEPGKLLHPTAFSLAADGRFVVADAPGNKGRIQVFLTSGANLGGFTLATREVPTLVFENYLQSGIGSLAFMGRSILINQPELGTLLSEYAMDGGVSRTFGTLRPTGQEHDREVNLALNTGLPIINPQGGFYFVFLGGVPMFRKDDAAGRLSSSATSKDLSSTTTSGTSRTAGRNDERKMESSRSFSRPSGPPVKMRTGTCGCRSSRRSRTSTTTRETSVGRSSFAEPASWRHGRSSSREEEPFSRRPGATS